MSILFDLRNRSLGVKSPCNSVTRTWDGQTAVHKFQKCSHSWSHPTHRTCLVPSLPPSRQLSLLLSRLHSAPEKDLARKLGYNQTWGQNPLLLILASSHCVPGRGLRSGMHRRLARGWAEVARCPKGIPARVMGPSLVPDTEPWRLSNRKRGGGGGGGGAREGGRAGMLPSQPPVLEQTVLNTNDLLLFMSKGPGGPGPCPNSLVPTTQAPAYAPFLVLF